MNPIVKEAWVAALRSGDYRQASGRLKTTLGNYCCLGVLCELHRQITGQGEWSQYGFYFNNSSYPPGEVSDWAGLQYHQTRRLAEMNDQGQESFVKIADFIEKEY